MTFPEQARDDLHFLRGAVERQHRLHRMILGPPIALIWATYVLMIAVINSPSVWEHTHTWAGTVSRWGFWVAILATAILPWYGVRHRGEAVRYNGRDYARLLLPWLGCAVVVFLFLPVAEASSMRDGQRFYVGMLLVALTAFQVGLAGSLVMLSLAIGSMVGLLAVVLHFGMVGFAVPFFVGLVGGAFLEDRRARQ